MLSGNWLRVGHHRLPPTDIVIAACAHHAGAGVLHYDRDYDVLAQRTNLSFQSQWLAPAGTLDADSQTAQAWRLGEPRVDRRGLRRSLA
jgi:hypothetical protein